MAWRTCSVSRSCIVVYTTNRRHVENTSQIPRVVRCDINMVARCSSCKDSMTCAFGDTANLLHMQSNAAVHK